MMKTRKFAADLKAGDLVMIGNDNYEVESNATRNADDEWVVHLRINRRTSAHIELVLLDRVTIEVCTSLN